MALHGMMMDGCVPNMVLDGPGPVSVSHGKKPPSLPTRKVFGNASSCLYTEAHRCVIFFVLLLCMLALTPPRVFDELVTEGTSGAHHRRHSTRPVEAAAGSIARARCLTGLCFEFSLVKETPYYDVLVPTADAFATNALFQGFRDLRNEPNATLDTVVSSVDDQPHGAVQLRTFLFPFYGRLHDTLYINPNGFVAVHPWTCGSFCGWFTTYPYYISPMMSDLNPGSNNTAAIHYLEGISSDGVPQLTVQWSEMPFYVAEQNPDALIRTVRYTFQAVLRADGDILFLYYTLGPSPRSFSNGGGGSYPLFLGLQDSALTVAAARSNDYTGIDSVYGTVTVDFATADTFRALYFYSYPACAAAPANQSCTACAALTLTNFEISGGFNDSSSERLRCAWCPVSEMCTSVGATDRATPQLPFACSMVGSSGMGALPQTEAQCVALNGTNFGGGSGGGTGPYEAILFDLFFLVPHSGNTDDSGSGDGIFLADDPVGFAQEVHRNLATAFQRPLSDFAIISVDGYDFVNVSAGHETAVNQEPLVVKAVVGMTFAYVQFEPCVDTNCGVYLFMASLLRQFASLQSGASSVFRTGSLKLLDSSRALHVGCTIGLDSSFCGLRERVSYSLLDALEPCPNSNAVAATPSNCLADLVEEAQPSAAITVATRVLAFLAMLFILLAAVSVFQQLAHNRSGREDPARQRRLRWFFNRNGGDSDSNEASVNGAVVGRMVRICPVCTLVNSSDFFLCAVCATPLPAAVPNPELEPDQVDHSASERVAASNGDSGDGGRGVDGFDSVLQEDIQNDGDVAVLLVPMVRLGRDVDISELKEDPDISSARSSFIRLRDDRHRPSDGVLFEEFQQDPDISSKRSSFVELKEMYRLPIGHDEIEADPDISSKRNSFMEVKGAYKPGQTSTALSCLQEEEEMLEESEEKQHFAGIEQDESKHSTSTSDSLKTILLQAGYGSHSHH